MQNVNENSAVDKTAVFCRLQKLKQFCSVLLSLFLDIPVAVFADRDYFMIIQCDFKASD